MDRYLKAAAPFAAGLTASIVLFAFGESDTAKAVLASSLALAGIAYRVPNRP